MDRRPSQPVPPVRPLHPLVGLLVIYCVVSSVVAVPAGAQSFPLGDAFVVSQSGTCADQNAGQQTVWVEARGSDDGFRVVWLQDDATLRSRSFDGDGAPVSQDIVIAPPGVIHDLAGDATGRFVTVRSESIQIKARRFDATGTQLGAEIDVTPVHQTVLTPTVAMNEAGSFVVAWPQLGVQGLELLAKRYAEDGTVLGDVLISADPLDLPGPIGIELVPDSEWFVVTWSRSTNEGIGSEIWARIFDDLGQPASAEIQVNDISGSMRAPRPATDVFDVSRVVWERYDLLDPYLLTQSISILGRSGTTVPVDSPITAAQENADLVVSRDGGRVAYVWESDAPLQATARFGDGEAIFVASDTTQTQSSPVVSVDDLDRATVVWLEGLWDPMTETTGCATVRARRFQLFAELITPVSSTLAGRETASTWHYYRVDPDGAARVSIDLDILAAGVLNDIDLYVRRGALPDPAAFDCRPFAGGGESESCVVTTNGEPLWIGLHAFQPGPIPFELSREIETGLFFDGFESGDTSEWSASEP